MRLFFLFFSSLVHSVHCVGEISNDTQLLFCIMYMVVCIQLDWTIFVDDDIEFKKTSRAQISACICVRVCLCVSFLLFVNIKWLSSMQYYVCVCVFVCLVTIYWYNTLNCLSALPKIQWKRIKWSFHVFFFCIVVVSLFLFGFQFLFLYLIERSTISLLYYHRHTKHNKVNERFSVENLFEIDVCVCTTATTTTKKRVHGLLYQNDIYRNLKIGNKC